MNDDAGEFKAVKLSVLGMADLPDEILRLIMGLLCFEDQNRLRAVCRNWRRVEGVKPRFQLPWLLVYCDISCGHHFAEKCYFMYNPSTKKSYLFEVPFPDTCSLHPSPLRRRIFGPIILATNSGWFLTAFSCCSAEPFLFNPFTRRTVHLPAHTTLPHVGNRSHMKYAFHFCPIERRFTVYAVWVVPGLVVVSSWSTGEQEWETHEVAGVQDDWEWAEIRTVCDGKGALYCYFVGEKLVALFRRAGRDGFDCVEAGLPGSGKFSLCVLEGDLYAVKIGLSVSPTMRLDLAGRAWVAEENDEKAHFHGENVISAVVVSEPVKEFAGRVVGRGCKTEGRTQGFTFQRVPASVTAYRRTSREDRSWSFPWPQEMLGFYSPEHLKRLYTIWIEPPVF